jgi:uroporphyrinogen-III decarboxylase
MSLSRTRGEWGERLALVGNVDVRALLDADLARVRREVDRCVREGGSGSGYMLATCNSIFEGMNSAAVGEYFRYAARCC